MTIIIGLGNPGRSYAKTRHNAGFMTVDAYAQRVGAGWKNNKKLQAELAAAGGDVLAKPLTFMNNSGIATQAILAYYKLLPKKWGMTAKDADLSETLTVIHDDIDLPLGKYKTSIGSRSGGHNGIESIITHLKTKNFKRIRVGIAPQEGNISNAARFVLQKFTQKEEKILREIIDTILKEEL